MTQRPTSALQFGETESETGREKERDHAGKTPMTMVRLFSCLELFSDSLNVIFRAGWEFHYVTVPAKEG